MDAKIISRATVTDKTIHIITSRGFECDVDRDALDDMELLDDLIAVQKGDDVTAYGAILPRLIGEDGKKALYEHLRGANGRVKASDCYNQIAEIIKLLGEQNNDIKN